MAKTNMYRGALLPKVSINVCLLFMLIHNPKKKSRHDILAMCDCVTISGRGGYDHYSHSHSHSSAL